MLPLVILLLTTVSATAGGFDRFQRDETLLFNSSPTVVDVATAYTFAAGKYVRIDDVSADVGIGDNVLTGAARVKLDINPSLSCLMSLTEPFRTDLDFGKDWERADFITSQRLRVREIAATCAYKVNVANGFVAPLAGFAHDTIDFNTAQRAATGQNVDGLSLSGSSHSWRAGLAYQHASKALTASVVYYSGIDFNVDGEFRTPILDPSNTPVFASVGGEAEFPQSVRVDVAISLAPTWLLALAGQWSDWSSLDHVPLAATTDSPYWTAGQELIDLRTFFQDGLTASIMLGHAHDADWASWVRVSWDRATSTGWTEHSKSYALQLGVRYHLTKNIDVSAALTAIQSADIDLDRRAVGAPYNATFDGGTIFVPQINITSRF